MTDRDLMILSFLTDVRVCTKNQIQELYFKDVHNNVCLRRLKYLTDNKMISRSYFNLGGNVNSYVYYMDKKPSKRTLKHELLITEFYLELCKNGFEIISFEKSPLIAGIIPDAIIKFRRPKHQEEKYIFLEVQLSPHDCIKKYFNIRSKVKRDIPNTLYIITDQEIKNTQLRDLRVVIDNLDFKKVKTYFS